MIRAWRSRFAALIIPIVSTAVVAGCGGTDSAGDDGTESGMDLRVAAVFSGTTTDADYTALGLQALERVEDDFGADTAYSENVAVPDAERVIREYLADGFNVIWTHGSQFYEATAKVAAQNPDVYFIGEFDDEPADPLPNVWVIDRNFHVGFYPIGALAALASRTGKIGYVGGLSLPFSYSEVHAMRQAIADLGSNATITPVWTGDFNDPAKAQQITTQLMDQGHDVIVGSLNLGMVGAFQATKGRPEGAVLITAKYTDKSQFDPEHYATSVLYDFAGPLAAIVEKIQSGEGSGYYPLGFETGVEIQDMQHVDDSVKQQVQQIVDDVKSGTVTVEKNLEPIE